MVGTCWAAPWPELTRFFPDLSSNRTAKVRGHPRKWGKEKTLSPAHEKPEQTLTYILSRISYEFRNLWLHVVFISVYLFFFSFSMLRLGDRYDCLTSRGTSKREICWKREELLYTYIFRRFKLPSVRRRTPIILISQSQSITQFVELSSAFHMNYFIRIITYIIWKRNCPGCLKLRHWNGNRTLIYCFYGKYVQEGNIEKHRLRREDGWKIELQIFYEFLIFSGLSVLSLRIFILPGKLKWYLG